LTVRLSKLTAVSIAPTAGAILPFAFAPYGIYPAAILCIAVLFYLWEGSSVRQAALLGWLFGIGMFGHGVWWIQVSVHQFGLPLYTFSVSITILFVVLMALYPAVNAYVARRVPAKSSAVRLIVVYPLTWALFEWLRGWLFTGFPWLLLGYSQIDSPLAGTAPIIGCYGTGLIAAVLAGSLVYACRTTGRFRFGALGLIVLVFLAGGVLSGRSWTSQIGEPIKAVLVQGAVPQELKWRPSYRQSSIELYTDLSKPYWNAQLVVWPETALPAFPFEIPEVLAALSERARSTDTDLLIGMPTGQAGRHGYFNSVVALGPFPGRYDKRRLVPFGEYLPFDDVIRKITGFLNIPMSDFSRGAAEQTPLTVAGHEVAVSICYEDAYSAAISDGLPAAAFLINVSNDAWFGDSIAPHQHLEIARMRALETGRYMLRATNTGISAVIDDQGQVLARSPQFVPHVLTTDVIPREGATPYVRYGDRPVLIVIALGLLLAIVPIGARR